MWIVLGLVGMLYVDQTPLSAGLKSLVRVILLVAPILVSLGFFIEPAESGPLVTMGQLARRPQQRPYPDQMIL